ncbi:MAG: AraC family transcriptional regulator [Paenibacillus sp.]|jgi:AraC-like DNA-binding protein|nr:AraC family transcriptional regulator [Paenibacillus sp.]
MEYVRFELRDELFVRRLISFSYKELSNEYSHQGEKHDFWEFAYVDKGEVLITTESGEHAMRQGDLVFYRPNEYHSLRTNHVTAPNLFIVAFDCYAPAMNCFGGQIFSLGDEERRLIAQLMEEGGNVFDRPIHTPRVTVLTRSANVTFGSEQLIRLYLETLLIVLARKQYQKEATPSKLPSLLQNNKEAELTERVTAYMKEHLSEDITVDHICAALCVGKSQLKKAFKSAHGSGIMETFNDLKIEEAKVMIRETSYNFTEIGERLGYNSIHYFSKNFKKATGMTPSEYARSAKALTRIPERKKSRSTPVEAFQNDFC